MLHILIIQSLISALVFILRKPKSTSNYILSFWFALNAFNFIGLLVPGGIYSVIRIGYLPFLFLQGPIFYFYVLSLIKIDFKFRSIHLLHLLPFLFICIYRQFAMSASFSPASFYALNLPREQFAFFTLVCLSFIIYFAVIITLLFQHKRNIQNYFSNKSERITLNWVFGILVIIVVSNIVQYFLPLMLHNDNLPNLSFWCHEFNLGMLAFILLIFGLLQTSIYVNEPVNLEERKEKEAPKKYVNSGLSDTQIAEIKGLITTYLEENKPYLNPEYSLEQMAKDLNITRQNLSQVINEGIEKNFYQLINELRVEEFKTYLNDPKMKHITLLGLAYEAGFNSKSSFYRIFKDVCGETPTEYRQRIHKEK